MRPLWRDLILRVYGADPLQCPCCKGTMKVVDTFFRSGESEFFLRLHGPWEGIIDIPPPPVPPFDIDTFEPFEVPWQAIREWIPADDGELSFDLFDQRPASGKPVEIPSETATSSSSAAIEATERTTPEKNRCQKDAWKSGADHHSREQRLNA